MLHITRRLNGMIKQANHTLLVFSTPGCHGSLLRINFHRRLSILQHRHKPGRPWNSYSIPGLVRRLPTLHQVAHPAIPHIRRGFFLLRALWPHVFMISKRLHCAQFQALAFLMQLAFQFLLLNVFVHRQRIYTWNPRIYSRKFIARQLHNLAQWIFD